MIRRNTTRTKRDWNGFSFPVGQEFGGNKTLVTLYAEKYLRHGYMNESVDDAARQCAADLMDTSARLRFKREVERLRKYYPNNED
jgi:hypothetical protein